jgi:hypothetical protein
MTDADAGPPIHPGQGRMFSSPAQLAAEGAADQFHAAVLDRVTLLAAAGADPLTLALLTGAASAVYLELRSPRPRPSAILSGIKLLRDLIADASPEGVPIPDGGPTDDEWLAEVTRAASLRNAADP